ncbi:hypothetical protein TTHERM_000313449 (macronuclear) [Tetrahymena thermophila SB210]|uniref:Uncharacterized protein n=1 Tax=Tetrahymena thermophila (strain SB210) TaxID=312017 RepID=W7WZD7_TETTS|nr:hypothetical protein TTHERM_000313449 [Tetrahymena thermophila SB210]EWS72260.1 hypothetical protein TTHERM_000313449 [Tetrahymena thermophila SB210]|eukprot:XP_012655200.1 hypothetical protein TTHERM_000313449 [Tetrahymena thermophila SB210]
MAIIIQKNSNSFRAINFYYHNNYKYLIQTSQQPWNLQFITQGKTQIHKGLIFFSINQFLQLINCRNQKCYLKNYQFSIVSISLFLSKISRAYNIYQQRFSQLNYLLSYQLQHPKWLMLALNSKKLLRRLSRKKILMQIKIIFY